MSYLLDTQVWLWMRNEPEKLRNEARTLVENPRNRLHISAATAWEIATKASAGRLRLPVTAEDWLTDARRLADVTPLSITFAHAARAGMLPRLHRDPFDRMLVAQAQLEGLTIITADAQIATYDIDVVRA